ncbi:MAG: SGNH/GDSL hydrolase family protein [Clostridia bacterium]|nr:SGNH/GDSL hydrolase family protein [Clostridia bacterium]
MNKSSKVLMIVLAAVCVSLAVVLFVFSRNRAQTQQTTDITSEVTTMDARDSQQSDITLALSEYKALLNWKSVKSASGYVIYYDSGSGWEECGRTPKTAFRCNGFEGGTSYVFGIKPYTKNGDEEVIADSFAYTIRGNTLPDTPEFTVTKKNNIYSLSWESVNNANEYIVYSMLPDQKKWTREGITDKTSFQIEKTKTPEIYLAVRAVRYADGEKYVSDYNKTYVSDIETVGKMYSCGDSVAMGVGSHSFSYADIFAQENNLELIDTTSTGSQLCSVDENEDHICEEIIKNVTNDYKYVFIEGGNNDYYSGAPLGEVTPAGSKSFNLNTVCGALESAFTYLQKNCPDSKVIFVLMHEPDGAAQKKNDIGLTFNDYAEVIREVCTKYKISVADCLKDSGLKTTDTKIKKQYTFNYNGVYPEGDGVHPTEQAYRKFYMPLINKLK